MFVVGDGLSAFAAAKQALPLLQAVRPRLDADGWRTGPVVVATQARVALGDEIGELLRAKVVAMLIGERPGNQLAGQPRRVPDVGAEGRLPRCIAQLHLERAARRAAVRGAAHKLHYLMTHARRLGLTGVGLKDDSDALLPQAEAERIGAD